MTEQGTWLAAVEKFDRYARAIVSGEDEAARERAAEEFRSELVWQGRLARRRCTDERFSKDQEDERLQSRRMGRNPKREFDKTYLSLDAAEERQLVHRDYLAHCLRWSHTMRWLLRGHRYRSAVVLDVGCGIQMPLAKALYTNKMTPGLYVGVDVNAMTIPEMLDGKKIPIRLFAETDFCSLEEADVSLEVADDEGLKSLRHPILVTSFEVLEHVTPAYCRKMLTKMQSLVAADGAVIISTPCWNGSAAGNHINEMKYEALGAMIEDLGFGIEDHFGTFASIRDYEDAMSAESKTDDPNVRTLADAFADLREYYDSNVLAILFAPLYPSMSRNCLWRLSARQPDGYVRKFKPLVEVGGPWSQHADWRQLAAPDQDVSGVSFDPTFSKDDDPEAA